MNEIYVTKQPYESPKVSLLRLYADVLTESANDNEGKDTGDWYTSK